MLTKDHLRATAQLWLGGAKVLFGAEQYGLAVYLSGYAAEFQLKARIVEHQGLAGYPSDLSEFRLVKKTKGMWLKDHDLNQLLEWSGREAIKTDPNYSADWFLCAGWTPEQRYGAIDKVPSGLAANTLESIERLLPQL